MTILEQLREIIEAICDDYCKYGEKIHNSNDDDEVEEAERACETCPLCKIE